MSCMVTECFDCVRFTVARGVPYLGTDRKEQMDVYMPACADQSLLPCVIVVPGEGWAAGRRGWDREARIANKLLAHGYIVMVADIAAVHYSGEVWNEELTIPGWPTNLFDLKAAVQYARKHAPEYGINPGKIGVIAGSTEGHVALLSALTANYDGHPHDAADASVEHGFGVRCIMNLYGIPDLLSWGEGFTGVPYPYSGEKGEQSVENHALESIAAGIPAMFIVHGQANETNSITLSASFADQLQHIAEVQQYVSVDDVEKAGTKASSAFDLRPVMVDFLAAHLK
ncbi:alpha/beta hydrolase [Paenibacillus sp. H1-7]|uniref:alpha/beta hydrolase n=1 Tax=Paenibacillus sp. H1-7 TaxID=2282849 RepID=UPI001EF7C327|nr:alpha/beta hydrolase [Paenibacillus sp. H1-7]ULL16083.1 alpha/beta hydrolase [Paenibacillus sp. H1-7]